MRVRTLFCIILLGLTSCLYVDVYPQAQNSGQGKAPQPRANTTKTKINPKDGAKMILIPEGAFLMGEDDNTDYDSDEGNHPRHTTILSAYYIYEKPVTVEMYLKFCKATGHAMPDPPEFNPGWKNKNHPIVRVSWYDAKAYCKWAGVRLPTEAEWEKAARGTDGRKYPWGNTWDGSLCANSVEPRELKSTVPIGSYPKGASPYGVLDMAGNVFQWCEDYYDPNYWKTAPQKDPTGPKTGKSRMLRGGGAGSPHEYYFRTYYRGGRFLPIQQYPGAGFRCASTP